MKKSLIPLFIGTVLFSQSNLAAPPGFFDDTERGWFWWEVKPEEPEEEPKEEPKVQMSNVAPEKSDDRNNEEVVIGVKWLKENLPKLEQAAVENPTETNLANYAYAQRLSLDYASRFSSKMMEFMTNEQTLSEERRRPTTKVALNSFNFQRDQEEKNVINMMADTTHIWFFYRSDCPYCHKQIPILKSLQQQFGFEILAVSMDGLTIPGAEDWPMVIDRDLRMTKELKVVGTPSLFLVSNKKEFRYPLTSGLQPLDKLFSRISLAAKETGAISEDEYNKTKFVVEENVFEKDEVLKVKKKTIEEDPSILTDMLRKKLQEQLSTEI